MKISILSNTNIDALARNLKKKYDLYKADGYNNWIQEMLHRNSGLNDFNPDAVFIILDGTELIDLNDGLEAAKSQINQYFKYIEEYIAIKAERTSVFISNFDIPKRMIQSLRKPRLETIAECYWYNMLCTLCSENKNTYVFDIKSLMENTGRNELYSNKLWYLGGIKYSLKGQKAIEDEIDRYLHSIEGYRKKCIVLDLDNTLWGGIVGEVGLQGIVISDHKEGARYRNLQMRLKEIKDTGIILAVVSKNNYEDVIEVFKEHKGMYLKKEDFAAMKINWEPKARNIEELAGELNLGIDSIVFIDDNPVEREAVKFQLPQVAVPDFPEDSADIEDFIIKVYNDYFFSLNITVEDEAKTGMYKQNSLRDRELKASNSIEDYLLRLQTHIKVWMAEASDVDRIAQLTQKTNQFNLTTKRYTEKDINKMIISDEYDVYIASVEDKFGDNGKVVVLIVRKEKDQVEIDTFLMSCRIMGRFIEEQIISYMENKYRIQGFKTINAAYLKTNRNLPVSDLFERLGYDLLENDRSGNKRYRLALEQTINNRKNYGELIEL
jgi:FkbH-like protein